MDLLREEFANENQPEGVAEKTALHPLRAPLISIPDPLQNPREAPAGELELSKDDCLPLQSKSNGGIPRSAQSTPTKSRSGSRPKEWSLNQIPKKRLEFKSSCPSAEIRHFDLDADPSFWNDNNVQVLIRIRPISSTESALQGNERCLAQESSKTLIWTGHPETRFTFDHVACETISQETLFHVAGRPMVENCMRGYNSCMFVYGQTGSGKTYTMMGESNEARGITPRMFELLFERIKKEEEEMKSENLKYTCKCSYLEIFNEHITDLLDPSSTNLQIREDLKKGVYVENLKEHDVFSVSDIIELLVKGTANRKMAATSMNSESSRSHSVFTCRIESQWERDSMVHIRFGRLNLVDLAGSERQKSSGAEGERLREAASINKSLSTLGLVIMTLIDIANGKHRHAPYRDSRLTFLLQDSLGGNSKTAIIANVSPSICSAHETLSTLKFAQRAKLIQNNPKVNEDSSSDVIALQREIQRLRDKLNTVTEHRNASNADDFEEESHQSVDSDTGFLREALAGSLKREQIAENRRKSLEAKCERLKLEVQEMKKLLLDEEFQGSAMLVSEYGEKYNAFRERIDENLSKQAAVEFDEPNTSFKSHTSTRQSTDQQDELNSENLKRESVIHHSEVDNSLESTFNLLKRENQELKERLNLITNANSELLGVIDEKEVRINVMAEEWEKAILDLTGFLLEGYQSLDAAAAQMNTILDSFPNCKTWINDHVERVMKLFIEKELLIINLKKNLEDAQKIGSEMKSKFDILRGAMLAMTETHEFDHEEIAGEFKDYNQKIKLLNQENETAVEEKQLGFLDQEGELFSSFCEALSYASSLMIEINELFDAKKLRTQISMNNPEDKVGSTSDDHISDSNENSITLKSFSSENLNEDVFKLEISNQISKLLDGFAIFQQKLSSEAVQTGPSNQINSDMCYEQLRMLEQKVEEMDSIYSKTKEILAQEIGCSRSFEVEEAKEASNLFVKFEEVNKTMKEADIMVQQLLLANEKSLLEVDKWKQISKEVQTARDSLAEELDRTRELLVDSISNDRFLFDQITLFVTELATVMDEIQEMAENHATSELTEIRSNAMSSIHEILEGINGLKLLAKSSIFPEKIRVSEAQESSVKKKEIINDHKGNDLTLKIAMVDAMLSFKRGIESSERGNLESPILIPNKGSLIKSCTEKSRREIVRQNALAAERKLSSVGEVLKELRQVKGERDKLQEDILHLNEKLDLARAMADENEALAVEACSEAKASKIYAQEKEEEVRVLESTVSELESTIDVLENKVSEMADEVKRCQQTREEVELGLQTLRTSDARAHHLTRDFDVILLELYDSKKKIEELEERTTRQAREIKRYEEHISEVMLHSEAQSSLYHQKFQNLESMVSDAKKIPSSMNKIETVPVRSRGSGSPFKCMSSLIQQMNSEKDRELSLSKIRVQQLEALAANRQKQVCMLSARLAAVDNMTHDVIRDLLEVKLDMTNYADTIELANQKISTDYDSKDKDEEIIRLKRMFNDLLREKDRWMEAMKGDFLTMQEKLEKLQHKHQLLTAKNDMLKMDKRNLTRKIAEQEEIMKVLVAPKSFQELIQSSSLDEEIGSSRSSRPSRPGRLLQCSRTSRYSDADDHRPNISGHRPR